MSTVGYMNIAMEIFGGLLSLIFILCISLTGLKKERLEQLYIRVLAMNMALLFCDAAAWFFKGHMDIFSRVIVRVANFGVFTLGYILLAVFTDYLVCFAATKNCGITKKPSQIMWALSLAAIGLTVLSQFNHMYYIIDANNIYHRQDWFWLSQVFGIVCMLINGNLLIRYRKYMERKEQVALWAYILMPVIAMVIQLFIYGIAVLYIATTISALCIYISIQVEQARRFDQKELELERNKTAVMLSQIQPHFMYNALNTIHFLCRTQPEVAASAVENFSDYLRGNLDALTQETTIPFSRELEHLKSYLGIEQLRFPDVNIAYDLKTEDFFLPALTLQPMVENAIRYGVTPKEDGGTVSISTWEDGTAWYLQVEDDGVGFEPQKKDLDMGGRCQSPEPIRHPENTQRSHIGISNTRRRLEVLCGGTLTVNSAPGKGTRVLICIPKKEEAQ